MAISDQFQPIGGTGLSQFNGIVYDDPGNRLHGATWYRTIREMTTTSPVVRGMLFAVEMLLRRAEWHLDPADESPEAAEISQFIDECRTDMDRPWEDTLASVMSFLPFGVELPRGDSQAAARRPGRSDRTERVRRWAHRLATVGDPAAGYARTVGV